MKPEETSKPLYAEDLQRTIPAPIRREMSGCCFATIQCSNHKDGSVRVGFGYETGTLGIWCATCHRPLMLLALARKERGS